MTIARPVLIPTFFISTAPTQLVRQTMRPRDRSKLPVSSMIDWPRATMATVELCSRIVFQLSQVRKYCAPNLIYEMMENTMISSAMPTSDIQSLTSAPTPFLLLSVVAFLLMNDSSLLFRSESPLFTAADAWCYGADRRCRGGSPRHRLRRTDSRDIWSRCESYPQSRCRRDPAST